MNKIEKSQLIINELSKYISIDSSNKDIIFGAIKTGLTSIELVELKDLIYLSDQMKNKRKFT
ncbi:hypothetical protein KHQ81_10910 [Mycoplasmatota bacterium]|nr:hypothetical protein KHQ81_10910 [Mycoplasmatota bacterium]